MEKIDIVYLWVDGSDKKWLEKKNKVLKKFGKLPTNSVCKGRFRDNNELMYSLRSVEKFAPWVNNIFIITMDQKPSWLNTKHPKIHIIDHKQIMPKEALPTYNSIALEMQLDKIPGLSEKFVFLNDDFFFGKDTSPEYFFNKEGFPTPVLRKSVRKKFGTPYIRYFKDKNPSVAKYRPLHTPTPYRKSFIKDIKKKFKKEVDQTTKAQFRDFGSSTHRYFFTLYDMYQNRTVAKVQERHPVNAWFKFWAAIGLKPKLYNIENYRGYEKNVLCMEYIKKYQPNTFCINDGEETTPAEIKLYGKFLKSYFPKKSSFEK